MRHLVPQDRQVHRARLVVLDQALQDALPPRLPLDHADRGAHRAAQLQRTGGKEDRVAQGLRLEASRRHVPEQARLGVEALVALVTLGAQPVGVAEDQLADERLGRPTLRHELGRHPVEQLGMGRQQPALPEVVLARDDPLSEQVDPDTVDPDAGGERVVLRGDPLRELAAAAAAPDRGRLVRQDLREAARDPGAGLLELPTLEHARVAPTALAGAHGQAVARQRLSVLTEARQEVLEGLQRVELIAHAQALGGLEVLDVRRGVREATLQALLPALEQAAQLGGHLRPVRHARLEGQLDQLRGAQVAEAAVRAVQGLGAAEDARHRVVVLDRDRIELVVVAAGAGQGHAEHPARDRVDLLVDHVDRELDRVARVVTLGADGQVAGRDLLGSALVVAAGGQEITGELLAEELVVGQVRLESVDDPVPVAPGVGIDDVRVLAARLRVARDVEPVAAPALGVAR